MLSLIHSHLQWKVIALTTSIAVGLTSIVALIPQASGEAGDTSVIVQKTFTITAYYSPLPDQSVYLTGTLSGDRRINGNGTNGADGTPVFPGFIAAPSTYAFGTKIHCPPFISGVVHDRGGAIVKSGVRGNQHDRLDLWAGRGEEGLKKALFWGKRSLTCTVYAPGTEAPAIFANLPDGNLSKYALSLLKKAIPGQALVSNMNHYFELLENLGYNPNDEDHRIAFQIRHEIIKNEDDPAAGNIGPNTKKKLENLSQKIAKTLPKEGLEFGHEGEEVKKLQSLLHDAGYLAVKPTGAFKELTKEALVKFQLDQKLIDRVAHRAAGYVGPGTKKALQKIAAKNFGISKQDHVMIRELKMDEIRALAVTASEAFNKEVPDRPVSEPKDPVKDALTALTREWIQDHTEDASSEIAVNKTALANVNQKIQPLVSPFTMRLGPGIRHPEVKKLQVFLKEKGFFAGELITEVFGTETKKAVIAFQLQQKLIASKTQADAGIVGPKTLAVLNALHYQDEYSLPIAVASKVRAPAVHPRDLKIGKSTPLSSRPS